MTAAPAQLVVLDPSRTEHWAEVHQAGCRHLQRRDRHGRLLSGGAWPLDATDRNRAVWAIAADLIDEGTMSFDEAKQAVYFAPCIKFQGGEQ